MTGLQQENVCRPEEFAAVAGGQEQARKRTGAVSKFVSRQRRCFSYLADWQNDGGRSVNQMQNLGLIHSHQSENK
jgi:hypothetical protein